MISDHMFLTIGLLWFFGWGLLLIRYPAQTIRVVAWGRMPTEPQVKRAKFIGYKGLFFGCLLLVFIAAGIAP